MTDSKAEAAAAQLLAEAIACLERNHLDEALENSDKAIGLNPDNAENHYARGNALRRLGRHAEALSAYGRAIELKPDHAMAYAGRGLTLAALNRFEEAATSYDKSIEIKPNAEAYKRGGDLCSKLSRFENAVIFYNNAIVLKPDYASAYGMRASALENLGRHQEAREHRQGNRPQPASARKDRETVLPRVDQSPD
jgi:tetratricopeptide (TPR) repeat protein